MKGRLFSAFLISVLVFTGAIYTARRAYANETGEIVDLGDGTTEDLTGNPDVLTFLMVGVDADEDPDLGAHGRTDTMMVVRVNFKTGAIKLLSLPRDSRVDIDGNLDKLNHAHAYGGIQKLREVLESNFGIHVDYYVKVTFDAVKEMVDAMGGITLDVPVEIHEPTLHVMLDPGVQTLDGNEALMFVRYRKGYENGDIGRVQAQQYFMKEFVKQLLSPKNIWNLPDLVTSFYKYVETNMLLGQIVKLLPYANKLSSEKMEVYTLPGDGEYIGDTSYYILDWPATNAMIREVFGDGETMPHDEKMDGVMPTDGSWNEEGGTDGTEGFGGPEEGAWDTNGNGTEGEPWTENGAEGEPWTENAGGE